MQTRIFGKTGIPVSVLGLGTCFMGLSIYSDDRDNAPQRGTVNVARGNALGK